MREIKLPTNKEIETFSRRLGSNRPAPIKIFNGGNTQSVKAVPLGHMSPHQFREIAKPTYFQSDFDDLSDEILESNVDYKMSDLEKSVKTHGVLRPVLIDRKYEGQDPDSRPYIIDGNHRAIAAIRTGVSIPTYVLHKSERWRWS